MPKNPRDRTLMNSQHVEMSKIPLKSARQYFRRLSWSIWKKINWKNLLLVVSEILRLLVNKMTRDGKYSLWLKACV